MRLRRRRRREWAVDPETGRRWDEGFEWPRFDLRRALAALDAMGRDPNRTDEVAEFLHVTAGRSFERLLWRVMNDPQGRRVMRSRRDLLPLLMDRERLRGMPAGSLGREYYEWSERNDLTAQGLADQVKHVDRDLRSEAHTLAARVTDMHDLWHCLNGWGTDLYGEMHLLGFSYAQLGSHGWLIMGLLFNLILVTAGRYDGAGYFVRGYLLGKRARPLPAADWEALLGQPIGQVRRELRLPPPRPYRPMHVPEWERLQRQSPIGRLARRAQAAA